jgi:hypothetical protein
VLVIDEDLGAFGVRADALPGFQRLVPEVGLDHVGIEMSRLARGGRYGISRWTCAPYRVRCRETGDLRKAI